ncbi:MAG: hypothetical protein IKV03_04080 [Alphaproteobacteria bacterium]|nr:hypothetical protein [Alphaproteobacteria bacterium]
MTSLKSLIIKAVNMPIKQLCLLLFIMLTVFIKSVVVSFLDISIVTDYLTDFGVVHLPFSYIFGSFVLMAVGYYCLLFERRHGYGSIPVCMVILLIFIGISGWIQRGDFFWMNFAFWFNLGLFGLLGAAFWSVASRFVPLQLESRKFIAILCTELIGFAFGGSFISFLHWQTYDVIVASLILLTVFVGFLKILTCLAPVESETFLQKTGGAQDSAAFKLIYCLLGYSFTYMLAKGVLFYSFYQTLTQRGSLLVDLANTWTLFGAVGLGMVLVLYQTRFLYMIVPGIMIFSGSFLLAGTAVITHSYDLMLTAIIVFMASGYFYLMPFLTMLLRPLAVGRTKRIKWLRMIYIEPLGFMFAGVFLYFCENDTCLGVTLQIIGLFLAFLTLVLVKYYSDILLESFKRRQWRGGPLILSQKNVLNYLLDLLKSENANEVIYSMRILGISKHPAFEKNLVKLLRHPNDTVRLFSLNRIELYQMGLFYKSIENVMNKDKSSTVRQYALSMLMQSDYEYQGKRPEKYMRYLSDRNLRAGVLIGLLKAGGDYALMAMDTLQRLAFSKKSFENIEALKIIEHVPLSGLVRLVEPLMRHSDEDVVHQALLTAGAMKHPQLLGAVFEALDDVNLQETALLSLEMYGKKAFPPLEKMLHSSQVSMRRKKILVLFLDRLSSGEGKQILLRAMSADNQKLRKNVMYALINSGIVWIHKSKKAWLTKALQKDLKRIHFELDFIQNYTQAPTHETEEALLFLRRALEEDINNTRELILLQLQLLKPHPLFAKAIAILLSDKKQQYETALGVIQDFLPYRLYKQIKPIALLSLDSKMMVEERIISEKILSTKIGELLLTPPFELPSWIKATGLYCLRRLGCNEGKMAVVAALEDKNPIVLEAAIWALVRLEKDEAFLHDLLLRVPTSRLAGQSLEQILES